MKKFWLSLLICLLLTPSCFVSATEQSPLSIDMDYVVIKPTEDGSIALMNMTSVKNTQNKEYKGDGKTVVNIHIPKGASNLQVHDNSLGMTETNTGFITTKAIPASGSIVVPYSFSLTNFKEGFELKYDYPVEALLLLVPVGEGSLELNGMNYTLSAPMEFEGTQYYGYNLANIEAKKPIVVMYDRTKQPSQEEIASADATAKQTEDHTKAVQEENEDLGEITHSAPVFHNPGHLRMWYQSPFRSFEPHVLMGALALILIGGTGYYSYFRWKGKLEEEQRLSDKDEQAFLQLIAKRKAIMDKIVELEENYSSGQLSDDEYRKKLEAYKHHLLQVKLNLQKYTE